MKHEWRKFKRFFRNPLSAKIAALGIFALTLSLFSGAVSNQCLALVDRASSIFGAGFCDFLMGSYEKMFLAGQYSRLFIVISGISVLTLELIAKKNSNKKYS